MYIFASTFEIPRLRHIAMDRLLWCHHAEHITTALDKSKEFLSNSIIQRAYADTQKKSKLREVLVHSWVEFQSAKNNTDKKGLEELPKDFLIDVMICQYRWGGGDCSMLENCHYHEHATEQEKRDCDVRVTMTEV
jgi:hypothetical protein